MKTSFLVVIIFVFLLLFVTYPFKIKWSFHVNLIENIGFVVFKVLFIRLLCERFKINNNWEIETEKEKKKSKKSQKFFKNYIYNLSRQVDVKRIDLFCDIGADDSYFASMLCGCINAGESIIWAAFLNNYKSVKIYSKTQPYYEENRLEATGKIIVSFNMISVFLSLYRAFRMTKKGV